MSELGLRQQGLHFRSLLKYGHDERQGLVTGSWHHPCGPPGVDYRSPVGPIGVLKVQGNHEFNLLRWRRRGAPMPDNECPARSLQSSLGYRFRVAIVLAVMAVQLSVNHSAPNYKHDAKLGVCWYFCPSEATVPPSHPAPRLQPHRPPSPSPTAPQPHVKYPHPAPHEIHVETLRCAL